jgi:hypothetical protein
MNDEKKKFIKEIIEKKMYKELIFVHIPKCGGTFVISILKDLEIKNIGHKLAPRDNNLYFSVIREPVERFESLLNFRLSHDNPMEDWPKSLIYVYNDKKVDLNKLVEQMTDNEIISFKPYHNLEYWSENIDILITLDELKEFLELFNYKYNETKFIPLNVSKKERGKLNEFNKERIKKLFINDITLYNKWLCPDFINF